MTALLVIQTEDEREKVKRYFGGLEFDITVLNHPDSIRKVEGLRFTQVWFTPDVMTQGMDNDLFDLLHRTLIHISTVPSKGFRLLG